MSKKSIKALVDDYASVIIQINNLKKLQDELRPAVVALGEGLHTGREHALVIDHTTRASLSIAVAKSLLTPAEIAAATIVVDVTTVRIEK